MRRFMLLSLCLMGVFWILFYVMTVRNDADRILATYREQLPFSDQEMTYRHAERPLFGRGVVMYQPAFPRLPVHSRIHKLTWTIKPGETTLRFNGITLDIAGTLRQQYRDNLTRQLRQFQAPDDFVLRPLMALALLNQDTFKGDIILTLRPRPNGTNLTLTIRQGRQEILTLQTDIALTDPRTLWGWTHGTVQTGTLTVSDTNLLTAVMGYYAAVRRPVPEILARAVATRKPLIIPFQLNKPLMINSLIE